ncbi:RNA-directed DNA polymerase from mobile element jockey [Eumeta japonica]|uniref:RNA-directed DNA polymerase from mobile element jockey n=1 Tax=Eumeta variegata TaxID=151549 RepID=A0A4C1TU92_EUMVA|nr:RNA-directed DNA polymerase from mobile element jockey [Eumeta japonica]
MVGPPTDDGSHSRAPNSGARYDTARNRWENKHKRRLHKLWTHTRCPRLKKKLNEFTKRLAIAVKDYRGAAWEEEDARKCMAITPLPLPGDLFLSPAELHEIVLCLPKRKAPGPDGISTETTTKEGDGGHGQGKDPRNLSNLRPITLLSHVAKIFERALLKILSPFLSSRKEQYGSRTGHSTTLQLIWVVYYLLSEIKCRRYTVALFLDMEKAFDRVLHNSLLHKLLKTRLPSALTKIIASLLRDRNFCVAVEDALSDLRPIRAKVPQGSVNKRRPHSSRWRMAVNVGKTAALLTGRQRNMPIKLRLRGQDVEWKFCV